MANVVEGEPRNSQEWLGSYLDEDGIVADIHKRVSADAVAVRNWLDPVSWAPPKGWSIGRPMPFAPKKLPEQEAAHAGSLMFAPMAIRNFYGLWHADNPYTVFGVDEEVEITDGVVTDKRHPDNLSFQIIERVKAELRKLVPEAA